ncbi:MAG: DoxX family protein [Nitrospinae bacterium]|nr:DoxX family protein [Nitrospinota bacterium]
MASIEPLLKLAGRLALSAIFIWAAFGKIMNPSATVAQIQSAGMPMPGLMYALALASLIAGGAMLLLGWRTRAGAAILVLYLAIATYYFHYNLADRMQMVMALKNAGLAGGLLYVIASGPGKLSLDRG